MAKRLKKRKKLTRRARQGSDAAAVPGNPRAAESRQAEAAPQAAPAAPPSPAPTKGASSANTSSAPPAAAPSASAAAAASVGFRTTTRRGPDGIDSKLAAVEYPAIRRDLRKLGLTVAFFVAVVAALSVLGSTTSVISDLGRELFKLWR